MTIFRMLFAAEIKKVEAKSHNGKVILDIKICKKNRLKEGEEATFTWLGITIFDAPEWMVTKAVAGNFIAGSGEFSARSYVNKAGEKQTVMECRASSFDIEISDGQPRQAAAPAQPHTDTIRKEPRVTVSMSKPAQGGSKNWEADSSAPPF